MRPFLVATELWFIAINKTVAWVARRFGKTYWIEYNSDITGKRRRIG